LLFSVCHKTGILIFDCSGKLNTPSRNIIFIFIVILKQNIFRVINGSETIIYFLKLNLLKSCPLLCVKKKIKMKYSLADSAIKAAKLPSTQNQSAKIKFHGVASISAKYSKTNP
jgi:hypothetical protein